MSNILISSPADEKETQALLSKSIPRYRQAYSDRTAWLMACISELAYLRFNPIFKDSSKEYFLKEVSKLVDDAKLSSLNKLVDLIGYSPEEETKKLEENADFLGLKLGKTFDSNGTQAILLENSRYVFLGFRGTEATSIKDIKADANAVVMACDSGGNIHSGFNKAFDEVYVDIVKTLAEKEYAGKPVFITGHSLGGALATIAAKKLNHKGGIAACYTFGSPRVGDAHWVENIKTPIYRVVNAADPVTMLPPGSELIGVAAWLFGLIPNFGGKIKKILLAKFGGYLHAGDMRYLTNCEPGNYSDVRLLYAVSWWFRMKAFFVKKMSFLKMPADHSITVYRRKLKIIAQQNNAMT